MQNIDRLKLQRITKSRSGSQCFHMNVHSIFVFGKAKYSHFPTDWWRDKDDMYPVHCSWPVLTKVEERRPWIAWNIITLDTGSTCDWRPMFMWWTCTGHVIDSPSAAPVSWWIARSIRRDTFCCFWLFSLLFSSMKNERFRKRCSFGLFLLQLSNLY